MRNRVENEEKKKIQSKIDDLMKLIETLKNTNGDQNSRIQRL